MGYRSDVALAFYCKNVGNNFNTLEDWVKSRLENEMEFCKEFEKGTTKGFVFNWEWVKWYDEDEDVQRVDKAIDEFNETFCKPVDTEFMYEFVRIGEEDTDVEKRESNTAEWFLSVSRKITFCDF